MSLLLLPAIVAGYLIGSIPFGLIFTRLAGYGDVRRIGSGNIGATNVLRTGNKKLAAATLLCDVLKGTAAVFLGMLAASLVLSAETSNIPTGLALLPAGLAAGLAAFIGHVFPVWLGFHGGKGVAVYIGVLIGLVWQAALVFCAVWLIVAAVLRYSSLSALVASFVTPFAALYFHSAAAAGVAAIMSIVLVLKHRANIKRLVAGEEPRIGHKTSPPARS